MFKLLSGITIGLLFCTPAIGQSGETAPPPFRYSTPTLEPAKLQLARSVASKLLPVGTTDKVTRDPLNMKISALVHDYLMMPVEQFAQEYGVQLPQEGVNGPPIIHVRLLEILDPASQTRLRVISPIISQMAAEAAASKESELREALAIAYGQRLNVSELQALDKFLATPEGAAFVRCSATIDNDLGVFAARQSMDRAIVQALPAMTTRLAQATASLPKIRDAADLSEAERTEVAQLLRVDPARLTKH